MEQSDAAKVAMEQVDYTFAPWVAELGITLLDTAPTHAILRVPSHKATQLRGGPGAGVICGQAVAAIADTACVYALTGANGRFRNCTTTDMSVRFARPLLPRLRGELKLRQSRRSNRTGRAAGPRRPA